MPSFHLDNKSLQQKCNPPFKKKVWAGILLVGTKERVEVCVVSFIMDFSRGAGPLLSFSHFFCLTEVLIFSPYHEFVISLPSAYAIIN